ncbi:peptidoglycan/xylan/chitin deacetylase (PgdA/CDA1 family) [Oceanihabitans sediminis]|uniref:Polysaccharide deacetylase family protein n=1 Tax=Oceanihabitans sediminis TaxID=1812012 RepID=A0A368P838_9FLAO|nr:polysaccharide deacetylase family protein [Oceanihabitans sediminis]RBP34390.1 peptidoglycan/xylan/chitin deacetylase (PgdA/CDA1 family) [Oceanihabitans sediminis]RCU58065.1 polysaccharide deacetylase family protein [Oceanihabitans sediminis]
MNLTPVKTPLVVKKIFPNYIWDIKTNAKEIYLTFDDGPTPEITKWTLETLKQYNAKATFFCIGNNIEKHPKIFYDILKEGHSIGNHTHNHIKGWKTSAEDYLANVKKAQEVIDTATGKEKLEEVKLFRPPYGQISPKQGSELLKIGYKVIMWDVLSIDWDASVSKERCLNNVISKADSGSVVVFHDSVKASKNLQYALPRTLAFFSKKGYTFKAL